MAELRRLHRWAAFLLALAAFSLLSHYAADAARLPEGVCWSCRLQQAENSRRNGSAHAADLHERLLWTQSLLSGFAPERPPLGDIAAPVRPSWEPPTPVRPPIGA